MQHLSEHTEVDASRVDKLKSTTSCLRDILAIHPAFQDDRVVAKDIPVFLGHGVLDPKVLVDLGRQAHQFLSLIGLEAEWREYEALGHWYSGQMLGDIIKFLKSALDTALS